MSDRTARFALLITCLAYIALGWLTSAIGPLLPQLAAQTGGSLAAVGVIFSAIFFGGLLAQIVAGPASDRFGQRPVLLAGLALLVLGFAGVTLSRSLPVLLGCAALAGLGHGSIDIGCNLVVAVAYAKRNVAALNFLHLFFSLGSVIGPAVVSLSVLLWASGLPAIWLAMLLGLLLLPAVYRLGLKRGADGTASTVVAGSRRLLYAAPLLWSMAGLLGVYVGIEMGVGGWTTAYLGDTVGMVVERAALVTSGYWLALTAGRLISTLLGTRMGPYTILGLDLAGSLLAAAGLILGVGHATITIGATLLLGLSFGSIYPTVMALVTSTFRQSPGRAASVITAAGSLGGMLLPTLQGVLLAGQGPASSGWFALACSAAMTLLLVWALGAQRGVSLSAQ